jgi:hypothetical protein
VKTQKKPQRSGTEGTAHGPRVETVASSEADPSADALQSWKEIAGFIGRDERTAMRWAKEKGMPVKRIPGGSRGRVYGTRSEISAWLAGAPRFPDPGVQTQSPRRPRYSNPYLLVAALSAIAGIGLFVVFRFRTQSLPVRVSFSVDSVQAFSDDGQRLWTHRFGGVLAPALAGRTEISQLGDFVRIGDLSGNGRREVLVVAPVRTNPYTNVNAVTEIDCFSGSGTLLWSYIPHDTFRFGDNELTGPWHLGDLIIAHRKKNPAIYAAFIHATWGNSFVVEIDPETGKGVVRFVNTGTVYHLSELESSQGTYLLVGGFNNEFDGGAFAAIDEQKSFATSPQTMGTRHKCVSCRPGDPDYYLVFPRSELNRIHDVYENSLAGLIVSGDDLQVSKKEIDQNTRSFYLLRSDDPGFHVVSLRFDSRYDMEHQTLQKTGRLDHSLVTCPERLRPQPVKMWTPSGGWKELRVKRVQ